MASSLSEWRDVGDALDDAAARLGLGELLHDSDFTLQRTMTAVVVGSDRMDTSASDGKEDPYELLATPAVSVLDFSPAERLGFMDQLLTLQASYHEGTGLGRSVYTCLPLFDLEGLREEDPLLHEFCQLVAVLSAAMRDLLLEARVCEDEDFNIFTQGLPSVQINIPMYDALSKAEEDLQTSQKSLSRDMVKGLLSRVSFERYLLLGIRCVMIRTKASLFQAARYFTNAEAELRTIVSTASLKANPRRGFNQNLTTSGQHMRFAEILTEGETWQHFERLLEELKISTSIGLLGSYKEIVSFLLRFSGRHPGPIPRSAVYLQLDDRKRKTEQELPKWVPSKRMVAETIGVSAAKLQSVGTDAEYFMEQAMIGVSGHTCHIISKQGSGLRQRRRLKRGLEDWRHLYDHAQKVDTSEAFGQFMKTHGIEWNGRSSSQATSTNPGPFTVWCERETAQAMLRHLQLGFEQELYQPNELLSIYWYCDYLLARHILCTRELFSLRPSGGSPANKKQAKLQQQAEITRGQKHSAEVTLLEMERSLCQGLTRVLLALRLAGVVAVPTLPFNQEQNRFEQRFLAFWIVDRPEPLDFTTFETSISTGHTEPSKLLTVAGRFFGVTQEHCMTLTTRSPSAAIPEETTERVQQLERVAKTNAVAATLLKRLMTDGTGIKVRFNFETNRHYPCIAISR